MMISERMQERPTARRLGAGATALAVVGAVLAAPHAWAAVVAPGPAITQLPFFVVAGVDPAVDTGGPGTAAVNNAVAQQCNGGVALYNPQWFTAPPSGLGKVIAASIAEYQPAGGGVQVLPSGTAWVDTTTGVVVGCGEAAVDAHPDRPLSLVTYFADPVAMTACQPAGSPCNQATLRMYTVPTTGAVPVNDAWPNAKPIAALPFTEALDTTYATADGPFLVDYPACSPGTASPRQHTSVWWKYSPTTTGSVPIGVEPLGINAFPPFFPLKVAWVELTATGPVLAPRSGPACDAPVVLQAGKTYLVGVSTEDDAVNQARRITGGPVSLRVGAVPTPSVPQAVTVTTDNTARTTTVTWDVPATAGTSPVTGYAVRLADQDGVGTTVTLPATARSHTFTGLPTWTARAVGVAAVNASGPGAPAARAVSLTAATPAAPQIRAAVAGVAGGAVTATARWAPPGAEGSTAVSGYRVTALRLDATGAVVGQTVSAVQPATATSLAMTLPYAGSYKFTVQAFNSAGGGTVSLPSAAVTAR